MLRHTDPDAPSGFRYELTQEEHDAGLGAVMTGPLIAGTISMADGTAYDVTEGWIPAKHEHIEELEGAILKAHRAAGSLPESPLPEG